MERYAVLGFGLWAVCLKETDEMIGDCGLTMQFINHTIKQNRCFLWMQTG